MFKLVLTILQRHAILQSQAEMRLEREKGQRTLKLNTSITKERALYRHIYMNIYPV